MKPRLFFMDRYRAGTLFAFALASVAHANCPQLAGEWHNLDPNLSSETMTITQNGCRSATVTMTDAASNMNYYDETLQIDGQPHSSVNGPYTNQTTFLANGLRTIETHSDHTKRVRLYELNANGGIDTLVQIEDAGDTSGDDVTTGHWSKN